MAQKFGSRGVKRDPFEDAAVPVGGAGAGQSLAGLLRAARARGVLPLANRGLEEAPPEMFALADHLDEGEKFWEVVDLTRADLSHNRLTCLPPAVGNLTFLQALTLRGNRLTALPEALWDCAALTALDLASNELAELGPGVGRLGALRELLLGGNRLRALPCPALGRLPALETLQVGGNDLGALPGDLGGAAALTELSAAENAIEEVGPWVGGLASLRLLDLRRNQISWVDPALAALRALALLDLRENRLAHCPPLPAGGALARLLLGSNQLSEVDGPALENVAGSLAELHLQSNRLRGLPAEVGALARLQFLDVSNNDLADLPPALGYLPQLRRVVLDGNPLRAFRKAVGADIESLKKSLRLRGPAPNYPGVDGMDPDEREEAAALAAPDELQADLRDAVGSGAVALRGRGLRGVPPSLYNFPRLAEGLRALDLSDNALEGLPDDLCRNLPALRALNLSGNRLVTVSPMLGWLALDRLFLQKNRLCQQAFANLHPDLSGGTTPLLDSLQELDLRNNVLELIPEFTHYCSKLSQLFLGYNQLGSLENHSWSSYQQLSVLDVSNNRINNLGSGLEHLEQLKTLDIQNNDLKVIPPELGLCKTLTVFELAGNPQRGVRQALMDKGTVEVLKYLAGRLPEGHRAPPPAQPQPAAPPPAPGLAPAPGAAAPAAPFAHGAWEEAAAPQRPFASSSAEEDLVAAQQQQEYLAILAARQQQQQQQQQFKQEGLPHHHAQVEHGNYGLQPTGAPPNNHHHQQQYMQSPPQPQLQQQQQERRQQPLATGFADLQFQAAALDDEIGCLAHQLEDFSLSQAKKYAVKKTLAVKRAARNRIQRQLDECHQRGQQQPY